MAAPAITYESIIRKLDAKQYDKIYLLHGEEGYYIDKLVERFDNILDEDQKIFNQYTFYAPQTTPGEIMDTCTRLPVMSDVQVVIVKEAQAVPANEINKLYKYVANPSDTTILVICFRGEKAKGKDLLAAAKTNAVVFEATKIKEGTAISLIRSYLTQKGLSADDKSIEMLRDHIGLSVTRLYNEIDKLATALPAGARITPEIVQANIGVSKDYNSFELVEAIARKDVKQAFTMCQYFEANPKAGSPIAFAMMLFNFFADLMVLQFTRDKSPQAQMAAIGAKSPYALRRFETAARNYNAWQTIEIIGAIRRFDAMSKGNGSRQNTNRLFHELIFRILTAPGNI